MAISFTTGGTINNATAGTSLVFGAFSATATQAVVVGVSILSTGVSVSGITDTADAREGPLSATVMTFEPLPVIP